MTKLLGTLGLLALIFGVADLIHGPHNGDAHRYFIHAAEFISFFSFLCLLEVWIFRRVSREYRIDSWLAIMFLSLLSCLLGFLLFGLSGGSFHGDGGPIAVSFLLLGLIGGTMLPISFIVFVVTAISHWRKGSPIFHK
jgi:hypothetical protein